MNFDIASTLMKVDRGHQKFSKEKQQTGLQIFKHNEGSLNLQAMPYPKGNDFN